MISEYLKIYLTRQYSIFPLVFASINPRKEYCQLQSRKENYG